MSPPTERHAAGAFYTGDSEPGMRGGREEVAGLLESQERQKIMQQESEVDYNAQVIREREEGVRDIEATMVEVNSIMRDLNALIMDQGVTLSA